LHLFFIWILCICRINSILHKIKLYDHEYRT
jgi:hypothetical protein